MFMYLKNSKNIMRKFSKYDNSKNYALVAGSSINFKFCLLRIYFIYRFINNLLI